MLGQPEYNKDTQHRNAEGKGAQVSANLQIDNELCFGWQSTIGISIFKITTTFIMTTVRQGRRRRRRHFHGQFVMQFLHFFDRSSRTNETLHCITKCLSVKPYAND